MPANRDINISAPISGSDFFTTLRDNNQKLFDLSLGKALNPTGTNAYVFDADVASGLSGWRDGMEVTLVIPNTNTAGVTFNVGNADPAIGVKTVLDQFGDPFTGGELLAGALHSFVFDTQQNALLLKTPRAIPEAQVDINRVSFLNTEVYPTPGNYTWVAPFRCIVRLHAIGAGGGFSGTNNSLPKSGGGAGAHCVKTIEVNSGISLAVVVGAGVQADDGEASTITATNVNSNNDDIAMIANGGGAGVSTSGNAAGGVGGNASGGDFNWRGGNGADRSTPANGGSGGAVGFGQDGVSASLNSTTGAGLRSPNGEVAFPSHIWGGVFNLSGLGDGDRYCGANENSTPSGGGGGFGLINRTGGDGEVVLTYTGDLDA